MVKTTLRFLIWTVDKEPTGWETVKDFRKGPKFYEKPYWYRIHDDKIYCFGYAPGFVQALWHYVRSIPATLALRKWYHSDDGR